MKASARQDEALKNKAIALLQEPSLNDMGHSAYDAAWLARVPLPGTDRPAFPEVLRRVEASQAPDGGWDDGVDYVSARILATLASMLAITDFEPGAARRGAARRGAEYVCTAWKKVEPDRNLSVGFELLAEPLIRELLDRGLPLDPVVADAGRLFRQKMAKVPEEAIYSPEIPVGYDLESRYDRLDVKRAEALLLPDGSIQTSVSATAFFARATGDARALTYLRRVIKRYGASNIPFGWPVTFFSLLWSLRPLHLCGLLDAIALEARPLLERILGERLGPTGASMSPGLIFTDADDTVVALRLLADFGYRVDWGVLKRFERDGHFVTYAFENGTSRSFYANVLWAIKGRPYPGHDLACRKIASYLLTAQEAAGYWTDKWHASPLYTTAWAVEALLPERPAAVATALRWLLASEREGGGWGCYGKVTAEETAYAVQILAACRRHRMDVPRAPFDRAAPVLEDFLAQQRPALPRFFIGKSLFAPRSVVTAQIIGALLLGREAFGARHLAA